MQYGRARGSRRNWRGNSGPGESGESEAGWRVEGSEGTDQARAGGVSCIEEEKRRSRSSAWDIGRDIWRVYRYLDVYVANVSGTARHMQQVEWK